jgi:hypothetical protein
MLAYGAIAQLALAQFPQAHVIPPPPVVVPPRFNPRGVVVVVDVVPDRTYGTVPLVSAPFALIVNQPFIYTPTALIGPLTLQFTAPSGKVQLSDNRYLSVNVQNLLQNEQISTPQYLVYQTAFGEFNEAGVWQVMVQAANARSAVYFFKVGV